ncbi:2,3-dihydroxybenzoate-AMP ligase [Oligella ureolytica]|nr:2,3-dihydroxybenzoate-AMP ligase [Oligella ureolytica]
MIIILIFVCKLIMTKGSLRFIPYPAERAATYVREGLWQGESLFEFLEKSCRKQAENIALIQGDTKLSYEEFYFQALYWGEWLYEQGIRQGDLVVLQSANVLEFFYVLFGLYYLGAIPIFCLDGHRSYEIGNIAQFSQARVYLKISKSETDISAEEILTHFQGSLPDLEIVKTIQQGARLYSDLDRQNILEKPHFNQSNSRTVAFLQLSGGTTGLPKLIPRTHDDYLYSVRESAIVAGLNEASKHLLVLPVSHNYAMSSPGFLGVIYAGATLIIADNGSPEECFNLIEKHQITQVSLVPSLVLTWLNSTEKDRFDLTSLEVVQVGGAKFSSEIATRLLDTWNVLLQQVYGMAEGLVNYTRLDDSRETQINTQGKRLSPYDEIRIVNQYGDTLGVGEEGVITTKGPYTINGYFAPDEVNKHSFTSDGFYITGDIGFLDKDNNITVTGRLKEVINRAGEKVMPTELEELLYTHPDVKDVLVKGKSDELLGEKICVQIITDKPENFSLVAVRKYLMQQHIALNKLPDEVHVVGEFDFTLIGKVKR